jgi:restriction system protein
MKGVFSHGKKILMMYRREVSHPGLHKYQVVRGQTDAEARAKAQAKMASWDAEFARIQLRQSRWTQLDYRKTEQASRKEEATERTREAEREIEKLSSLLKIIVGNARPFNINTLKLGRNFSELRPIKPIDLENPREPKRSDSEFSVKFILLDQIFRWRKKQKSRAAEDLFHRAYTLWTFECEKNAKRNIERITKYNSELHNWTTRKIAYDDDIHKTNAAVDDLGDRFSQSDPEAIVQVFTESLQKLPLPEIYSGKFDLFFDNSTSTLVIDYDLPEIENLPTLKSIRYSTSRKEFESLTHKDNFIHSLFDNLVYQTCLGVTHWIMSSDGKNILRAVVFNGWITYLNRSNGNDTTACIASLHVTREEFTNINLLNVDAKACFRAFKGISSPQVHSLTPVRPIISLNREDSRFVQSRDVIAGIETGANIAAIGWEEFEHLIREIFEKELSAHGGEVKVTQASRDGGVDAVAFDPDPIRGGKIIIQAKRYTNTVDVSSVRDLYGTVMSEGATKGVLVTTSSFGPDAYRFAKDKPITLMDGNNLLFLLAKHGHQARIDLVEAKRLGTALRR